ncbi:MAG: aldehyde dehydrogenase family protein [Spirochaetia bacterium]|nr:aldehyde dehydrogenase family protein [Spirochaetia bacterium]
MGDLRSEIDRIYAIQKSATERGAFLDIHKRYAALKALEKSIRNHEKDLIDALIADFNKPELEIIETELAFVLSDLKHTIRHLKRWARPQKVKVPLYQVLNSGYIYKEPFGMALIMAPWNYPFQLILLPALAAIAAGNAVFLRPSTKTRHTAEVTAAIFREALDEEQAYVLLCSSREADLLLDYKWDFIFFTGSRSVGTAVYEKAARHLTPVILELGGKSPAIVMHDADLRFAARKIAWAKMLNAGQTCVSPDYVIVHQSVKERFLALLADEFRKSFRETDEYDRLPHVISESAFRRLSAMVDEARAAGNRVIECGDSLSEIKLMAPHLIDIGNFRSDLECLKEEIFGPVLPVVGYTTEDEMEAVIAENSHPLALYLFSGSIRKARRMMSRFSYGCGCINEAVIQLANPYLPFGGVGSSGLGFYHGKFGFNAFSHRKGVVEKRWGIDWPFLYRPYTERKTSAIRFFLDR